jgi:hypothetical protein
MRSGEETAIYTEFSLYSLLDHYLAIYTFFKFAIAISASKGLGPGTNGSAVGISV